LKGKQVKILVLGFKRKEAVKSFFSFFNGIKYCGDTNELQNRGERRQQRYLLCLRGTK